MPKSFVALCVLGLALCSHPAAASGAFPSSWCTTLVALAASGVSARTETLPTVTLSQPLVVGSVSLPRVLVDAPDVSRLWAHAESLAPGEFALVATRGYAFFPGSPVSRRPLFFRAEETDYLLLVRGSIYGLRRHGRSPSTTEFRYEVVRYAREGDEGPALDRYALDLQPWVWEPNSDLLNPFYIPLYVTLSQLRYHFMSYRFQGPEAVTAELEARLWAGGEHSFSAADFSGVSRVARQPLSGAVDRVSYAGAWFAFIGGVIGLGALSQWLR